jgi:hypothetical protein
MVEWQHNKKEREMLELYGVGFFMAGLLVCAALVF